MKTDKLATPNNLPLILNNQGHTIIEVLVVLILLALSAAWLIPKISQLIDKQQAYSESRQIYKLISFARKKAITEARNISICPSLNGTDCIEGKKNFQYFLITSKNSNTSEADKIGQTLNFKINHKRSLKFNYKSALTFNANGNRSFQNGSIVYCYGEHHYKIVTNTTGRTRITQTLNSSDPNEGSSASSSTNGC